jgi:hypothetical protein
MLDVFAKFFDLPPPWFILAAGAVFRQSAPCRRRVAQRIPREHGMPMPTAGGHEIGHDYPTPFLTQMYFEGEARNTNDLLLSRRSAESGKTMMSHYGKPSGQQEKDALMAQWDIVLAFG